MITMPAAEVVQIMESMGVKGVRRVRCKILEGNDRNRIITRNVVGPIKLGDVIMIKEGGFDLESRLSQR